MKKLFLLFSVFTFAVMANATSTTISPESATSDNNIRAAFNGTADTIYLDSGEYIQENQIHFKRSAVLIALNKNNKPVIKLKYYIDLINENTKVFVDGVIFDGTVSGQQCIRPYDDAAGKEIHFNDCEFYNFAKTAISGDKADCALDSCVVNDCKFQDINRSCIYVQSANLVGVKVTNSTFANITNVSGGDYASPIDVRSASANVLVDHCTMYNCATVDANYNYINVASTSNVVVSNSIFASAEGYDCCATYLKAGGSVANCLTYNLTNWQGNGANVGHVVSGGATLSDCLKADPLFKDAANGDFSLYASSQARGAANDASDLGDPRWYKALAPIAIPATLVPFDALLSDKASIIRSTPDSIFLQTESKTVIEWAKWSVTVAEDGLYAFTAYAKRTSPSGSQKLQIVVLNSAENDTLMSKAETGLPTECTISTGAVNLVAGNTYVIKVFNNYDWAKSKLIKVEATYEGGAIVNIPGEMLAKDAVIKAEAGKTSKMIRQANGDIEYKANASQLDEYAEWNIHATEAGEMEVSFNSPSEGHQFRFELYQSETLIGYVEESAASWTHNVTLTDHLTLPAAGDYTLKLINKQQYSIGVLHSITFTPYVAPVAVTMSDTDTDNSAWVDKVGGAACNVTLNRTVLGGMLNAICLPFGLTSIQVKAVFGNDVELYYLDNATLENGILDLQFGVANDIYQGTPYLIKTSSNVVNPTFSGVSIVLEEASSTSHSGWPVSFKGTFVSTNIAANGQNLLIYADNNIGFPESDKTLKGFRAYFHLSSPSLAPSINHARLIMPNNAPMDIDIVESQEPAAKSQKILRDGQLIIIRDGVQYNVMGARVK